MAKLNKNVMALTFKFDRDRFLRFRLATSAELQRLGVDAERAKRPGIDLVMVAGRRWEVDCYQNLLDAAGSEAIHHVLEAEDDPDLGRKGFAKVGDIFDVLRRETPPFAIIEGEFPVPPDMTEHLQEVYDKYGLETVSARPDIMWIRRFDPAHRTPLVSRPPGAPDPEWELRVIDVKRAAEPSLRHFTEVTYYALALAAALEHEHLSDRYAVSAEGFVWPGSHDANAFRNLVLDARSRGSDNPAAAALDATLKPVPYDVYQVHVTQFFDERLPRVLAMAPEDAGWHVAPSCQLCNFLPYCLDEAARTDHLSRIPWLSEGQAQLLRDRGIATTAELARAIAGRTPPWQQVEAVSHQLRAEAPALLARALALQTGEPVLVEGRRCATMPAWSHLNIYLSFSFDPGSGIAFAMGAKRVYFGPGRAIGQRPTTETTTFVVDRVEGMDAHTERARFMEFLDVVTGWLQEVHDHNATVEAKERLSAHIFVWDDLELTQLRRMLDRHSKSPDQSVLDRLELLLRLFPPDNILPDPDLFQSMPGTVVREVFRLLVGLPLPHGYTLLDAANAFHPRTMQTGELFRYRLPYGFHTDLSDQIPFERAYELWEDRVLLTHYEPRPNRRGRTYRRDEIYQGVKAAVATRLDALEHLVSTLRQHHGDRLTLKKSPFSAAPATQTRVPQSARQLIAFSKLDALYQGLENRRERALPIDEREARFTAIRGLQPAIGPQFVAAIAALRADRPRYAERDLLAFTFAPTSRDARLREADFMLGLTNEETALDLDVPWRIHLGLSQEQALALANGAKNVAFLPLRDLVQVELAQLEASLEQPFLVLTPARPALFALACEHGLLDLAGPLVLDHFFKDFSSKRLEAALIAVGGDPPPLRRAPRKGGTP